jgi:phospholipid/cholesterol/gamma-HCH transport system ATP-binding protein
MEKKPIIEVVDMVAYYGDRLILNQINLNIYEGEIIAIMGGSGAGKSTLLRHILALDRPASGSIRIFGKNISKLNFKEEQELRKNIGVSFQGGALFNSLTLIENVSLPLREHTKLDEKIICATARMKLEMVNLSGFEQLMPSELSGGMIKRAALARAIVMNPKLLFFDEPTSGLDPVIAAKMDDLILMLRKALGITITVVTHDLNTAFKIADRLVVLHHGEILQIGTVEEIRKSPNVHIQNLLNRTTEEPELDPEAFLKKLTQPCPI